MHDFIELVFNKFNHYNHSVNLGASRGASGTRSRKHHDGKHNHGERAPVVEIGFGETGGGDYTDGLEEGVDGDVGHCLYHSVDYQVKAETGVADEDNSDIPFESIVAERVSELSAGRPED